VLLVFTGIVERRKVEVCEGMDAGQCHFAATGDKQKLRGIQASPL